MGRVIGIFTEEIRCQYYCRAPLAQRITAVVIRLLVIQWSLSPLLWQDKTKTGKAYTSSRDTQLRPVLDNIYSPF